MIEPSLRRQLEPVARRLRTERLHRRLIRLWLVLGAVSLAAMALQLATGVSFAAVVPFVLLVGVLGGLFIGFAGEFWQPDYRDVARRLEALDPEFKSLLTTAVEQQPDPVTGQYSFLQARVVREAVAACSERDWNRSVAGFGLGGVRFGQFASFVFAAAMTWLLYSNGSLPGGSSVALMLEGYEVTPGDARVEKGSSLVVLARFSGRLPADAAMVLEQGGKTNRIALSRSLNDPVFGGTIRDLQADGVYRIEFGGKASRNYKLAIFEFPRLEKSDAEIQFPAYTQLDPKKVPDTRRVSAVEGSTVRMELLLNKTVRSASLVGPEGTIALDLPAGRAAALLPSMVLTQSQTLRLVLVDAEGLTNKIQTQFVFDALPNRPPALKWISPKGDQRVSALQEMAFRAEASDDFGLIGYGFSFIMPDGSEKEVRVAGTGDTNTLKIIVPPNEKKTFDHLFSLEGIPAAVDDLLTYHVWAEDIGPDGKLRRTQGDLFLSEVRPFEEIFRKAPPQDGQSEQQQQQQEQQQGNEATKLADLQKQVLNATWKLQRQLSGTRLPSGFKTNLSVVLESQKKAIELAEAMKEKVQDPRGQSFLDTALKQMERAVKELGAANKDPFRLSEATSAENAAYSALLKLSARETQVTQRKPGQGGGGGGGGQQQQQLDQLEMNEKENRYETKSQAQQAKAQSPEQKEQLDFLARLKELAQRQQDINERLKEMQNSLEAAKTEKEKEELRRELKRLREEQRELLADADAARQKMERNDKNGELADERKSLDETRKDMEKASESLNQEKVSDALASGSRVEKDLKNLQDEVRKKTSSQFSEAIRDLREEARKLAENQKELGEKLAGEKKPERRTLSSETPTDKIAEQLAQQKAALTNLIGSMTQVSQQAEASEPLLSKRLYDMVRQQTLNNTEDSLDKAKLLAERSLNREASQFEQRAREDINKLRQGVEQAAESVLGDEAQALELARKELDELSNQLNRELASRGGNGRQGTNGNGGFLRDGSSTNRARGLAGGGSTNRVGDMASNSRDGQRQPGPGEQQEGKDPQQGQQPGDQGKQGQKGKQGQGKQGDRAQKGQPGQGQEGEQPGQDAQKGKQGQKSQKGKQGQGKQGQGGQQPGQGQEGEQPGQEGQPGQGGQGGQGNQPGERQNSQQQRQGGQQPQERDGSPGSFDFGGALGGGGANGGWNGGPLTGDNFRDWNERLSNVEEMVGDARIRDDLAQVRDRVRAVRADFRRTGREPQWQMVQSQILQPLAEVQNRIAEELAKRGSREALVPIDRDPVPAQFTEQVRRYYEKLGRDN